MGDSRPRRQRIARAKLSPADLREWIQDYVAANRAANYEDCLAALIAEGYPIPQGGTRPLWELWDKARQDTYGRRVRG